MLPEPSGPSPLPPPLPPGQASAKRPSVLPHELTPDGTRAYQLPADVADRLEEVTRRVRAIYEGAVEPLAEAFQFDMPATIRPDHHPMVLVVGNHSSGKSTFINLLLGVEAQKVGLAPIDDGFTVLTYAKKGREEAREGAALVSDDALPFATLEEFGPTLVSHLRLKRVHAPLLKRLFIVDSPGMIDAADIHQGRGYNFPQVVKWFAERADVVLLFFDPDKPGTTGETLAVLNEALADIDHKLLLILNKVDRFTDIRDFARAYGALCWNLSKVIPRKDLPHIYTMYVPGQADTQVGKNHTLPLKDFDAAREEVISAVEGAPLRRIDNVVTRLREFSRRLWLYVTMVIVAQKRIRKASRGYWFVIVLLLAAGPAIGFGLIEDIKWSLVATVAGVIGAAITFLVSRLRLAKIEADMVTDLDDLFEEAFAKELKLKDQSEDLRSLWERVRARARKMLRTLGFMRIKPPQKGTLGRLKRAIDKEIPSLRARIHQE